MCVSHLPGVLCTSLINIPASTETRCFRRSSVYAAKIKIIKRETGKNKICHTSFININVVCRDRSPSTDRTVAAIQTRVYDFLPGKGEMFEITWRDTLNDKS
jgi:hypothetical protein